MKKQSFSLLIVGILSMTLLSCSLNKESEPIDVKTGSEESKAIQGKLRSMLASDPLMKQLNQLSSQSTEDMVFQRYGKTDWSYIKEHQKAIRSSKEQLALYKKAGMENAEMYMTQDVLTLLVLSKILKKYPEMRRLSKTDRVNLLMSLIKKPTLDENAILTTYKKNHTP